jgi:hypothetical protein
MGLPYVTAQEWLHGVVEDVMHLELRYRSDIDLSRPAIQVEMRNFTALQTAKVEKSLCWRT